MAISESKYRTHRLLYRARSCHQSRNSTVTFAPAVSLHCLRPCRGQATDALSIFDSHTETTPTLDSNTYPSSSHPDNRPKIAVSQMESDSYVDISPIRKSNQHFPEEGRTSHAMTAPALNSRLSTTLPCRGRIGAWQSIQTRK
jgi:hypothetical protein